MECPSDGLASQITTAPPGLLHLFALSAWLNRLLGLGSLNDVIKFTDEGPPGEQMYVWGVLSSDTGSSFSFLHC